MKASTPSTTAPGHGELDEFQAASLVGMSPKLLRWFTSYAPKQDSDRKLKARKEEEQIYFERTELEGFNDWLKLPWPSKDGARPPVPEGIKREIKDEAGGECAICHAHSDSCEAAHIVPVAATKNNHPENLIWLCANHHTKFDKHTYGPKAESAEFVASFKHALTHYRRALWQMQAKATGQLFTMLKACESLNSQLATAKTPDEVSTVIRLAKEALAQVPKMAPTSKEDSHFAAFESMSAEFKALANSSTELQDIGATLHLATAVKAEFAQRAGYVNCPLCAGSGHYKGEDCPACGGEAELTESEANAVDLARYTLVECPLCDGKRTFKGRDCPACGGDGDLERRYAEQIDTREWEEIDCPVCDGSGKLRGQDCQACGGEGKLERQQSDRIDVRDYALVDCPVCEGKGRFRGEQCPACDGEREMDQRYTDQIDLRDYKRVECPVCEGARDWCGRPCPACDGEGELDQRYIDRIDMRDFQMVECPACGGQTGNYCKTCDDERKIPRFIAEQL
ncbi:HNH endonuclease signature motif containing protein [Bosea sp. ASV33]|uniref:HNH endonuclease signature motif containing protein n=1 Tax=Bosea sp. ASV33 TaxID=2795106 RepID=UPI0018EC7009|nr:HNH endonuclease signature motif containing protein [Bosea sp. ASV33]